MTRSWTWKGSAAAFAACALAVASMGCGLDEVTIPALIGPSELGISVALTATPDIISADGGSQSVVQALVRDQNGKPLAGKQLVFQIWDGDGAIIAGGLVVGRVQTGIVLVTGSNGVAQVVYQAGTSIGDVVIAVLPYSFDANGDIFRTIKIHQY